MTHSKIIWNNDFQLVPFKNEKYLQLSGKLERKLNYFSLNLIYSDPSNLILLPSPKLNSPTRGFGLWKETCFEVFLKRRNSQEYFEFNFSPSKEWSCFHFCNYKERMSIFSEVRVHSIDFTPGHFNVAWEFIALNGELECGVTSVILNKDLKKSYWALVHPGPTPDFHDFRSFIIRCPQPFLGIPE